MGFRARGSAIGTPRFRGVTSSLTPPSGSALAAGYEYQDLLFGVGGSPASDVRGKLGLDFLGSSAVLDMTSSFPTAAGLSGTWNGVWGSGNHEASDVNKGFRFKFVGDLAQYDIPEATATPDAEYQLHDNTGSAPTKTSEQSYAAAVAEVFTLTPGSNPDLSTVTTSNGGNISCAGGLVITVNSAPLGYTLTAGGAAQSSVTFTANAAGPKVDETISTDDTGGAAIVVNTQGSDEVLGQVVVNRGSGAAGWMVFSSSSPSFSVVVPRTLNDAGLLALLNDAARYNGTVSGVSTTGSTTTIDFSPTNSPGTVSIGGATGTAVTAAITTVQEGANDPLTLGALARWDLSTSQVFEGASDPAEDGDAITQINDALSGGTKHLNDPGSGLRFIYRANYQNALPMAEVDNTNDVMTSSLLRSDFGNAAWYLMVVKPAVDGAPHEYCGLCNSFLGFHQWEIHKGADNKIFANGFDGASANSPIADNAATATATVVVAVFHRDRSVGSPNGFNELWINGVLQDRVAAGSPSINSNRPFFIGNNFYTGNFHWGEVIPFNGDPGADARITLASKVAMQKWGVS